MRERDEIYSYLRGLEVIGRGEGMLSTSIHDREESRVEELITDQRVEWLDPTSTRDDLTTSIERHEDGSRLFGLSIELADLGKVLSSRECLGREIAREESTDNVLHRRDLVKGGSRLLGIIVETILI